MELTNAIQFTFAASGPRTRKVHFYLGAPHGVQGRPLLVVAQINPTTGAPYGAKYYDVVGPHGGAGDRIHFLSSELQRKVDEALALVPKES